MQIMNKRGALLSEGSVKVIIAVAVVVGMVYLLVSLFSPVFDEADETAKSYFETLERAIEDVGGGSSFFMLDNGDDDLNFYLVYFGNAVEFREDGKVFTHKRGKGEYVLCVCSENKKVVVCKYCEEMKLPVRLEGGGDEWIVGEGKRMSLYKTTEVYDVSVKVE